MMMTRGDVCWGRRESQDRGVWLSRYQQPQEVYQFVEMDIVWELSTVETSSMLVLVPLLAYVVFWLVINPYLLVSFYEGKGFITEYKPIVSTFHLDNSNTTLRNEFYARMIDMSKIQDRPLGLVRNIGRSCMVMLFEPDMIRELFLNREAFTKHPFQNAVLKSLSHGLILLEGSWWKKHRKLVSKGFAYYQIDSNIPTILKYAKLKSEELKNVDHLDSLMDFYKGCAGQMISQAYFDYDIGSKTIDGIPFTLYLSDTIAMLCEVVSTPLYCATSLNFLKLGLLQSHRTLNEKIQKVRSSVRSIVRECVQKYKEQKSNKFSMWKLFAEAEEIDAFSEEEMMDEFITFFSDGVYTASLFMTMFTYFMIKNPQWKTKLEKELRDNVVNAKEPITQNLIQNLPVLSGSIKETLRLAPPVVSGVERIASKDFTFSNGVIVKKDTMLMACHLVNHLDARFHDSPEEFNPERWIGDTKSTRSMRQHPGSYIPFSIGERSCPGQKFAQIQSCLMFAQVFSSYDIQLCDPNYQLQFTQKFLREPLNPIACKISRK